jgi:hypothetical protein
MDSMMDSIPRPWEGMLALAAYRPLRKPASHHILYPI